MGGESPALMFKPLIFSERFSFQFCHRWDMKLKAFKSQRLKRASTYQSIYSIHQIQFIFRSSCVYFPIFIFSHVIINLYSASPSINFCNNLINTLWLSIKLCHNQQNLFEYFRFHFAVNIKFLGIFQQAFSKGSNLLVFRNLHII